MSLIVTASLGKVGVPIYHYQMEEALFAHIGAFLDKGKAPPAIGSAEGATL